MCQWLIPLPKNKFASLLEYSVNFFLVAWSFKYKLIDLKAFFLFQSLKDYGIVLLLGDDNRLRTKVCKSSVILFMMVIHDISTLLDIPILDWNF